MHIPHIPLGDEECLPVFGGLDVRWLYQFKERFQTRADVKAFIEQVIKSTGKTKLETITKQVRPQGAFEGERCKLVDALFVMGSEINRFERDNFLNHPVPSQEQPAHDSLDNPGGDFDSDSEHYPKELDIANIAWRAVAKNGQGGEGTPKQRLKRWLEGSGHDLSAPEIERIAAVCNWDKSPGRPKNK
ncbi:MAG: hypothetical protein L3K52_13530 [Candidatus Thiothrix sulfatifontis]|nr:MAG: hypothetical protein L3K52_13530 [Candidatus Thiothrix sulfatifontis]